jgi:DNA-binding NarL/FixJ family response regulator
MVLRGDRWARPAGRPQATVGRSGARCRYGVGVAIRIVLAEDNALLREGIRSLIEAQPGLELVGIGDDYDSLLRLCETHEPDVVLTDIRMPPTGTDEGIRAAAHLRATRPGVGVVVLSQYASPTYALSLLEGGTGGRAYLLKDGWRTWTS